MGTYTLRQTNSRYIHAPHSRLLWSSAVLLEQQDSTTGALSVAVEHLTITNTVESPRRCHSALVLTDATATTRRTSRVVSSFRIESSCATHETVRRERGQ